MKNCKECEEKEGFIQYRDNKIKKLEREKFRIAVRLEACLYSMVLMQSVIQDAHAKG